MGQSVFVWQAVSNRLPLSCTPGAAASTASHDSKFPKNYPMKNICSSAFICACLVGFSSRGQVNEQPFRAQVAQRRLPSTFPRAPSWK